MTRQSGWLIVLLLLLGGCTVTPQRNISVDPESDWRLFSAKIEQVQGWKISGRAAVRVEDEGWSVNLNWHQQQDTFELEMAGPMGQGRMLMEGSSAGVKMQTSEGETLYADNPERLMFDYLGWYVPVTGMRYWILGVPAPEGSQTHQLDEVGQLSWLSQQGWEITYKAYTLVDGLWLPEKVVLQSRQLRVRLVIDEWSIQKNADVGGAVSGAGAKS